MAELLVMATSLKPGYNSRQHHTRTRPENTMRSGFLLFPQSLRVPLYAGLFAFTILTFALPSAAQANDDATLFEVTDVAADVTADSAAHARDQAIAQAQRSAFEQLLQRLGADPATASSIFLTTASDVASMGIFLSLSTILLL